MKAAVVTDFHAPLQVQDLPVPEPGPGEILVRIETSGLCHTDIHTDVHAARRSRRRRHSFPGTKASDTSGSSAPA